MMKRVLVTALAAGVISTPALVVPAIFSPAAAQAMMNFGLTIGVPPPAPIYEPVPATRVGFIWAPGYWYWEGGHHVWAHGRWLAERRGYRWMHDHWVHHEDGYRRELGHWERG
jgi:hypothetical protein